MKKINVPTLFYIIFLFVFIDLLLAQEPNTLWTKVIGGDSTDVAYDVEELWDGGFAVVGYTKSIPITNYDIWLLRTNSNGDTLWTRTYGGNGDEYGYSLKKTDDGGFIIGGATSSFGAGQFDFYIVRTDSLGDTLWTRTFGGVNDDICWSMDKTEDGGFVLAGEINAFPQIPDAMIVKLNYLGDLVWEKIYGSNLFDRVFSIKENINGEFLVSGMHQILGVNEDGWLLKLNPDGDSLWSVYYGGAFIDEFFFNNFTSDLGNILVGSYLPSLGDYPDIFLVKTDSLGNEQWSKTLDYDNDGDIGYSVIQTLDGGYIIAGQSRCFDCVAVAYVVRTDSLGNVLWQKLFNQTPSPEQIDFVTEGTDGFQSVKQTRNGDYILAGYRRKAISTGYRSQVYLVRIASDIVPVELTSFTATVTQNSVSLNWQTATETNNSGFEIERKQVDSLQSSAGNLEWSVVVFVPGFGTTTEPKSYSFIDENLPAGKYQYRLKQIDFDGSFEYSSTVDVEINSPTEFSLEQNYPNPFNPSTKIRYSIPSVTLRWQSHRQVQSDILVSLKVFDVLGNEIATLVNEQQQPGIYEVEFNVGQAISLSSGVYYYQLRVGGFVETKKMILVK